MLAAFADRIDVDIKINKSSTSCNDRKEAYQYTHLDLYSGRAHDQICHSKSRLRGYHISSADSQNDMKSMNCSIAEIVGCSN